MPKGIQTFLTEIEKEEIRILYNEEYVSIHELRLKYKVSERKIYEIIEPRSVNEACKIGASKRPKSNIYRNSSKDK